MEAFQLESEVQEERVTQSSLHSTDIEKGDRHLQVRRWINQSSSMSFVCLRLSYLAHLDLCDNDLSSLDPKLLARTVTTVQDCDIGYTDLTSEQVDIASGIF